MTATSRMFFAIQSEIAKTIADQLQARLSAAERVAIEKPPTTDLTAYDLYLRAKVLFAGTSDPIYSKEKLPQAERLLDEAVARDPHFLLAWCLLARVHCEYLLFRATTTPRPVSNWLMRPCKSLACPAGCGRNPPCASRTTITTASATTSAPTASWPSPGARCPTTPKYSNRPATSTAARAVGKKYAQPRARLELDPRNFFILQQMASTYRLSASLSGPRPNVGSRADDSCRVIRTDPHRSGRRSHSTGEPT